MGKWITQVISPQVEYQRYENKVRARDSRLYTRKHSLFFYAKITYPIMKRMSPEAAENVRYSVGPSFSFSFYERRFFMNHEICNKHLLDSICYKTKLYLKNNSASILSGIGAIGVVATAVMAVKATPKALILLDEAKEEKKDELTKFETIRIAGPVYIPSILMGASTIACILGANVLNKQKQAALTSAYMLLENSYKDYRTKVKELYGEEADKKIREEMAKDYYEIEYSEPDEEKQLFYEPISQRYFESTVEEVQRAEYQLNRKFILQDYANLNDFYKLLGLKETDEGEILGWSTYAGYEKYGYSWVDFTHERIELEDGMECIAIDYPFEPSLDFMEY